MITLPDGGQSLSNGLHLPTSPGRPKTIDFRCHKRGHDLDLKAKWGNRSFITWLFQHYYFETWFRGEWSHAAEAQDRQQQSNGIQTSFISAIHDCHRFYVTH